MSSKIVNLESLTLMDSEENSNDGHEYNVTRLISVGHPYAEPYGDHKWSDDAHGIVWVEHHSDRDVVSIEYARNVIHGCEGAYVVTLKDGHELRLPEYGFIAETVEVKD